MTSDSGSDLGTARNSTTQHLQYPVHSCWDGNASIRPLGKSKVHEGTARASDLLTGTEIRVISA